MALLRLTITALSPLAFPTRKPGVQFRESLPYVPGAALYGALGAALSHQKRFDEKLLRGVRCHNAYPAHPHDTWVRPVPATALQHKGDDQSPPVDSLAARVCWEVQEPVALLYAPTDNDGRPLEPAKGLLHSSREKHEVAQRVLTRVAINRRRGTAEDQRLYSPLVLSEVTGDAPTQFFGSMVVPDNQRDLVVDAIEHITQLGGRQTTGLGAVNVAVSEQQSDTGAAIQKRVEALTERFAQQARHYESLGGRAWPVDGARPVFSVGLLSDAILFEHGWLPTQAFSAAQLREATGIEASLVRSFSSTVIVSGWHVLWRRPKATSLAVRTGGVFVFQSERTLADTDYERLASLQLDGIGERRAEGYGHIRICDEFHLEGQ